MLKLTIVGMKPGETTAFALKEKYIFNLTATILVFYWLHMYMYLHICVCVCMYIYI